jgi:hypothetical protein
MNKIISKSISFIFLLVLILIAYPSLTKAAWTDNLIFHAPFNDPTDPLKVNVGNGQFTFRRVTTATYIHPTTNLVTVAGSNVLPVSEDFSTLWTATSSQISVNQTTAPDGSNTADLFTVGPASDGNVLHHIQSAATSTGNLNVNQVYTSSVYVKQNSNTWISLAMVGKNGTSNNCYFNTTTGAIGTCTVGVISKTSTDVGSGWYRFSVSASLGSGGATVNTRIYLGENDNDWTWTGNNTNSVYVWGAQMNSGPDLAPYVKTTGDHSAIARIEEGGYLSENTRTNFILWSRDFTNAAWTKTNINTSKTAVGHDGVSNSATVVTASANDGTVCQGVTIATATSSASVDIKRVSGSGTVSISMDGGVTYAGDVSSQLSSSSWYRAVFENQKITNPSLCIKLGTNGDSVILDYAQIETGGVPSSPTTGPFVSSRIPTMSGAQTRYLDRMSIPGAGNWTDTEGTFFAVADTWDTARGNKFIVDGYSGASRVPMHIRSGEGNGSNGTLGRTTIYDGTECSYSSVNVQPQTSTKMISRWSAISGTKGTTASGAAPTNCAFTGSMNFQTSMVFGDAYNQDGTRSTFGHIKNARFYNTAFSDANMQLATAGLTNDIGTSPSSPTSLTSTGVSTSTVSLTWATPSSDGGSAITDYLIQYSSGGATSTFAHAPSTATSTTVNGLTANTSYLFAVSAINALGTSSPATVSTTTSAVAEENNTPATSTPPVVITPSVTYSVSSSGGSSLPANIFRSLLAEDKRPATKTATSNAPVKFTKVLKSGSSGIDVKNLQIFLNKNGFLINSKKGKAGSVGYETKTFGKSTKNALIKYQKKNKIYPADGNLNKATISHINKKI